MQSNDGREPTHERKLIGPELIDYSETHNFKIEPKESPEDAAHRRKLNATITYVALGLVGVLCCFGLFYSFKGNADQAKFGQSIVSGIIGAVITRLAGSKLSG